MARSILRISISLFGLSVLLSTLACTQTLLLPERWSFRTGDDSTFALPATQEKDWGTMGVPDWWEREGYDGYDGIAWYRVHFSLPAQYVGKPMILLLGRIDDADEAFLNGAKIGGMGTFPPHATTAWNTDRRYSIPAGLLERENVLAVRVNDMGGPGGIVAGPIGLSTLDDYHRDFESPTLVRRTWHRFPTSNGLIAAVYDERRGFVESVRPHLYQAYDSARYVEPYVFHVTPVLPTPLSQAKYIRNTHVLEVRSGDLTVDFFCPFSTEEKVFYVAFTGPASAVARASCTWERSKTELGVDSAHFALPHGAARKYFLFGYVDSLQQDRNVVARAIEALIKGNGRLLEREVAWMRSFIERAKMPRGLSRRERDVFEQSISVLKMAQVGEKEIPAGGRGEIMASLPPGDWTIAWVRDGMYAVQALNRLHLFAEAKRYLTFMLDTRSGDYVRYVHTDGKDYGIGVPYQISVCRYFGNGREESDYNNDGPNIEIDGFGMFLSAFSDYVGRSRDTVFFQKYYDEVAAKVADAIIHNITPQGVIRQESGPWERHLPGKTFAYPSITCAAGLRDFGDLCLKLGKSEGHRFLQEYHRLAEGIRQTFVVDNTVLKGNAEATDPAKYDFFDGGTIEAFALGVLTDQKLFDSDYRAYEKNLRIDPPNRGFARINLGDAYETGEWPLLDLRTASTLNTFGEKSRARWFLEWITNHASHNNNLIPELFDRSSGRYGGSIPMVGFGAGAYVVTLFDLSGRND